MVTPFEAVRQMLLRPEGSWTGMMTVDADPSAVSQDIVDELGAQYGRDLRDLDVAELKAQQLAKVLHEPPDDTVVIHGFGPWTDQDWTTADEHREAWRRDGSLVLLLGRDGVATLSQPGAEYQEPHRIFHSSEAGRLANVCRRARSSYRGT